MAALLLFAFFALFVGVWCLMSLVISYASGWQRLAKRFHYRETFRGRYYRFQSARLNSANYGNCLTIGASEEGLYLVPIFLLRMFHSPLLIPWSEIDAEPFKLFFLRAYRLRFRSVPRVTLLLSSRTFERILDYLEGQNPPEGAARGAQEMAR